MNWSPPLRPRPFLPMPTSTSLEDAALFVASSRPKTSPTPTLAFRSVSHSTEASSGSPSTSYSPYTNILSRMGLFSNDGDGGTTPKKGQAQAQTRDASANVNARKVLSPEAIFCDSPDPSSFDRYSLSSLANMSIQSNHTVRPNRPKTKRSLAKLLDLTLPGSVRASEDSTGTPNSFSPSNESDVSVLLAPAPPSEASPTTSSMDEDDEYSSDDEEYYMPDTLRRRGNLLHHRFAPEAAPYMQAYSVMSLNK